MAKQLDLFKVASSTDRTAKIDVAKLNKRANANAEARYERSDKSIAETIVYQLGGMGRLKAMIGAKDFYTENDGNTLSFKIGTSAVNKCNRIRITLDPSDTYTVEFVKVPGMRAMMNGKLPETVSSHEGIYCDMLRDLIEGQTGMYLSL